MYENVTSYLNRMLSLKRFAVFNESSEYPLLRSLLLGALCNTSTTEVFISDRSSGKYTHKVSLRRISVMISVMTLFPL